MSYMIANIEIIVGEVTVQYLCQYIVRNVHLPPHRINDLISLLKERERFKVRS